MLYYPYLTNDLGERTFFFAFHFFSILYSVDFFISFILRHLWVKQFFALRMSWSLRIVRVTFKFIILEKMRFINLELGERITEQRLKWLPATFQEQTRIEV